VLDVAEVSAVAADVISAAAEAAAVVEAVVAVAVAEAGEGKGVLWNFSTKCSRRGWFRTRLKLCSQRGTKR
jgi:hypothetical protein